MTSLVGLRILVAEDEDIIREMVAEEFEGHGAHVVPVDNGTKAFELFCEQEFDVVISDVKMPGGDGISLMKNIRQLIHGPGYKGPNGGIKLFLCSAYGEQSLSADSQLNLDGIIAKPFNLGALVITISNVVRPSERQRASS